MFKVFRIIAVVFWVLREISYLDFTFSGRIVPMNQTHAVLLLIAFILLLGLWREHK